MREVETLLRRDREAGLPEPPDPRYTVAAIHRRMGRLPAASAPAQEPAWPLILTTYLLLGSIALAWGIIPCLIALALAALCTSPLLLRKGA